MPWNPQQYLSFSDHRLRPALDLLARVDQPHPQRIVDLGCGPGNVTALLAERWPEAKITGVDNSPEMLAAASKIGGVDWQLADVATWRPEQPVDVLFSNATLHWLADHQTLFPRLARCVVPGGTLAIQIPNNFAAATHTTAVELAKQGSWRDKLAPHLLIEPVHEPAEYYRWLAPILTQLDIWQIEYLHVLEGDNPVADWTRGTVLVPLIEALAEGEREEFEAEYRRRIKLRYPKTSDGKTLLPFRRIFMVGMAGL